MRARKTSFGVLGAVFFVSTAFTLSNAAVSDTIRVNSGGAAYTDAAGNKWVADSGFSGGQTYSASSTIANTNDQQLHQDERWDSSPFSYTFNVTPGSYRVSLYEASLYDGVCNSGGRVFNVAINGAAVLTDYDMFNEVGCLYAQIKQFIVVTNDGKIKIDFTLGSASNPKINAIEIVPGTTISILNNSNENSKFSISSSNGGLFVQAQAEGVYTLELSNLQGKRIDRKHGFGVGAQSFTNLHPGLYFLTSRIGHEVVTRKVSVVR